MMAASLSVTMSSCGLYSKYEPQSEVDETLFGEVGEFSSEAEANKATYGDMMWSDIFTDPLLQGYIEQALANNSDLRSAELRVEQAEASMISSRLAYLPSLSLAPSWSTGGVVSTSDYNYKSYTVPVSCSWEIDIFGRITNTKLRTKMLMEQQRYAAQAVRTEIVAGVANLYYTVTMLKEQLAIAKATELSWGESYKAAQAMMESGYMDQTGLSQIEAGLYSVQMAVESLERDYEAVQNSMCSLLGIAPQGIESGELSDIETPETLKVGVPMQMLSSRPDLMAMESALAASFYSKNVARSAFYPTISLTGSLGWSNAFGTAILDPAEFIYSFVAQAVQPIFNKGLNRAQLKIAEADLQIATIAFEQKLLDSGIEVNDNITAFMTAQSTSALYSAQVEALERAAKGTQLLMDYGNVTYLEVLTSQQTLFNAQLGQVSNRFEQMQSLVALYKSLGGGRF